MWCGTPDMYCRREYVQLCHASENGIENEPRYKQPQQVATSNHKCSGSDAERLFIGKY